MLRRLLAIVASTVALILTAPLRLGRVTGGRTCRVRQRGADPHAEDAGVVPVTARRL